MLRAVIKNGVIQPLEPLPQDWTEGTELQILKATGTLPPEAADEWLAEMNALCADSTPEDEARLQAALDELKRASKELARRRMGLAG
jgi:hypothetical protein